jgi:hypothetical protein
MVKPDVIVPAKLKVPEVPLTVKGAAGLIAKHNGKQPDDILDLIQRTATELAAAAEQIPTSYARIMGNQLQSQIQNATAAKKVLAQLRERAQAKVDANRDRAELAIERLQGSILPQVKPDTLGVIAELQAIEVRQLLRGLKPNERLQVLNDAVAGGDEQFVYAALSSMPHMTGLTGNEMVLTKDYWMRHHHPETLQRIGRLKAALSDLDRSSSIFAKWASGVGAEQNASIAAAEQSAKLAAEVSTATASGEV